MLLDLGNSLYYNRGILSKLYLDRITLSSLTYKNYLNVLTNVDGRRKLEGIVSMLVSL